MLVFLAAELTHQWEESFTTVKESAYASSSAPNPPPPRLCLLNLDLFPLEPSQSTAWLYLTVSGEGLGKKSRRALNASHGAPCLFLFLSRGAQAWLPKAHDLTGWCLSLTARVTGAKRRFFLLRRIREGEEEEEEVREGGKNHCLPVNLRF